MQWAAELVPGLKELAPGALRVLEVGCLSPANAVAKAPAFAVTRIDLNSQHAAIEQQDFMERPLPVGDDDRFDLVSLSLVLNYVPSPEARGEMLKRVAEFLRGEEKAGNGVCPGLFLVMPRPCVDNSRYLTEARLKEMMASLGYRCAKTKLTAKLVYGLWVLENRDAEGRLWKKEEVKAGVSRNNFAIVMK